MVTFKEWNKKLNAYFLRWASWICSEFIGELDEFNLSEKRNLTATLGKSRVQLVEVLESPFTAEQFAVDDHGEVDVKDDRVVNGQAEHDADQCELTVTLERRRVEPELVGVTIVREHGEVRIEDLIDDQLEKFFG